MLKHVGRMAKNKRKVIVAYKVVPNEPENCIIVTTESLMAEEHDALMKAVESDAGQNADEFANVMMRSQLPDGRNMLAGFHTTGKMIKVPTKDVEMTPNRNTTILLSELNALIAQQKGVSVEDLAVQPANAQPKKSQQVETLSNVLEPEIVTDEDLAAKYRSDADKLFKEAKRLREEAEKLAPTKKTKKTEESA
jgi:hypothetical protein